MSWFDRIFGAQDPRDAAPVAGDPARVREVRAVLDELRPMFAADGGDVDLVSVEDGLVRVRLRGACSTCHASDTTLFAALEPKLRERCPWVLGVQAT